MHLINGVEISVTWNKRTLHIVGLKINPDDEVLKSALADVRASPTAHREAETAKAHRG